MLSLPVVDPILVLVRMSLIPFIKVIAAIVLAFRVGVSMLISDNTP